MEHKEFRQTETFARATKLTERTAIAEAFNCQNRIALYLELNADSHGDKGNSVKVKYHLSDYDAYLKLDVRRFADEEKITLVGSSCFGISSGFGLDTVREMLKEHDCQTVADGDKVAILVEDKKAGMGYVLTGTLRLPKYTPGCQYTGMVELD